VRRAPWTAGWLAAALLLGGSAQAESNLVLGVAPLTGEADGASRELASQVLMDALRSLPGVEVVSLAGLDQLLGAGASASLAACKDADPCVRRATGRVRTDRLVLGSLSQERTLRLRLIDSSTTAEGALVRVSRQVGLSDEALRREVSTAALELFPQLADSSFGTLILQGGLPGATVMVDGQPNGTLSMQAPPRASLRLSPGEHFVEVLSPGHASFTESVTVLVGQRTDVQVSLSKNRSNGPLYLAGGGVALAGVAVALGLAVNSRANRWQDGCPTDMACQPGFTPQRYASDESFVRGGRAATTGLWAVAGAAIVGSIVWFFVDPGEDEVSP